MRTLGYAAASATSDLAPLAIERRPLRADDVLIEVEFCGVCHTDLHIARNHGGFTNYPVVPGHEVVGRVAAIGSDITRFKIGDRVGVGCMVDSCGHCGSCREGSEQHCVEGATFTYNAVDRHDGRPTFGGYSKALVASERFVLSIPAALDPARAAPLLCAGITVWEPLRRWGVGKGVRLAVVGLGGLGQMAVKLGKAMGAEVTVFTRSTSKVQDALDQGADTVVVSSDEKQMSAVAGRFHLVIDTVPYAHDLSPYLSTVAVGGDLVIVGYMGALTPPVPAGVLVRGRKTVGGSFIGGVANTQVMLEFCAAHSIAPDIELIAIQDINQAFARLEAGDTHRRFVIDMATLPLA